MTNIRIERELVKDRFQGPRIPGAYYITNSGPLVTRCDRLPLDLPTDCPTCGRGLKPSQQPQPVFDLSILVDGVHEPCSEGVKRAQCPICWPTRRAALILWIPKKKYTEHIWIQEARRLKGVSWRIAHVPRVYVPGKTPILVASSVPSPHVFGYFIAGQIEVVLFRSQLENEKKKLFTLMKQGYKCLYVDDNDPEYAELATA